MTLTDLETRVATLEKKVANLAGQIGGPESASVNAWIDQVHGTFPNDATYRKAAHLGREWRKAQRNRRTRSSRKIAGK